MLTPLAMTATRILLTVTLLTSWVHAQAQSAAGQAYPTKSVRVIAAVLPGDTCDLLVRMVLMVLLEQLVQLDPLEPRD